MAMGRSVKSWARGMVIAAVSMLLASALVGCSSWHQPGETAMERRLRHDRTLRLNYQMLSEDVDAVLMLDGPSRLSEHDVP